MKKYILAIFIIFINISTINANEYLVSNQNFKHGGFGGFGISGMQVNGKQNTLTSFGGGWVINDTFYIGGKGYLSANIDDSYHRLSYGGLELGYIYSTSSFYNPFVSLLYGSGKIGESVRHGMIFSNNNRGDKATHLDALGIETGVQLKVNKWFRLVPFVGYTSISFDGSEKIYKEDDFGGVNYGIRFNFGKWRK